MKKAINEFKQFAFGGKILQLAVAVMMGGAVQSVTSSLVNSILMPLIGIFMGGKDFSSFSITVGNATVLYGNFIQSVINFLVIAIFVFMIVKISTKMSKKSDNSEDQKSPDTNDYLKEIRDILSSKEKNITD